MRACPTLCDPIDGSPPGSPVPGIPGLHSRLTRGKASSRGETKYSALLSSRDRYLLEPVEWPKGSKASCEVWRKDHPSLGPAGAQASLSSFLPVPPHPHPGQGLLTQAGDGALAPVVRWSLYLVSSTLMSYGLAHENIMCKLPRATREASGVPFLRQDEA